MRQTRVDKARFQPLLTQQGYLRADAWVTRSGILLYRNADGSLRREYRPDAEVFAPESLATLKLVPVTDDHPPVLLDSANTTEYSRGKVGEQIDRDGRWVRTVVQIDDAQTIRKIETGKIELSVGYTVDYDPTPGVTPEGESYDGTQRNIQYNHLAVVELGRASEGSERAALKFDMAEVSMVKVKVNGATFEVEPDLFDAFQVERDTVQAKLDGEKARADQAEQDLASVKAGQADAVRARVKLEREAATVLDGADLSGQTDREIKAAVVAKLCPSAKLDGASDVYVDARFDHAMETRAAVAQQKTLDAVDSADHASLPNTVDQARQAYLDRLHGKGK